MRYIEKASISESIYRAVTQIKSTPEWKAVQNEDVAAIRSQFNTLPKADIRKSLLQGGMLKRSVKSTKTSMKLFV